MSDKKIAQSPSPLDQAVKRATDILRSTDFPAAMAAIIVGKKIRKQEWTNAGEPESYATLSNGWLSIFRNGQMHPWQVNDGDLLGTDWIVME